MRSLASRTRAATASSAPGPPTNAVPTSITGIARPISSGSFTAWALKMFTMGAILPHLDRGTLPAHGDHPELDPRRSPDPSRRHRDAPPADPPAAGDRPHPAA